MTVTVCNVAFSPITGGSVNLVRTFGPASATGDFSEVGASVKHRNDHLGREVADWRLS